MKTFSIDEIRSWDPCYDPSKYLSEGWTGSAIDFLKIKDIPSQDKLWVVCREEVISAKTLRPFAVWCARQVEHLMTDKRSIAAIEVAEKFTRGEATEVELAAARDAAWDAAWDAARAAAWDAAGDAAWDAARDAARDAAGDAAWAAARDAAGDAARAAAGDAAWAARDAARAAAWDAAGDAAWDAAGDAARDAAGDAAGDAAWDAAENAQILQLIKMLEEEQEKEDE